MQLDWLIIGLGNPGKTYDGSLHNAGFAVLDLLLQEYQRNPTFPSPPQWEARSGASMHSALLRKALPGLQGPATPCGNALLVKPQTFMNLSGKVLANLRKRYEFQPERCLVLLDNLDLDPGRLRLKFGGGFSSHNGLRSLREGGLSANFWRLFIGIGHPGNPEQVSSYVLSKPHKGDAPAYQDALERASQAVAQILAGARPEDLATQLNRKKPDALDPPNAPDLQ